MIRELWLKGWKSHEDTRLTFTRGTNVLVGIMGSGKSSVLQAITFALFGDVPEVRGRKIAIDDLIMRKPRRLEEARVALEFDISDTIYKIERILGKKRDAKLYKEGKVFEVGNRRVTEKVCELLNTDYDSFVNVVYARQNEIDNFLRYGKGERVGLIDGLLKIDRLEEARKGLRSFHTGVSKRLEDLKRAASKNVDAQKVLLESSKKKLSELKEQMSDFQAEIEILKERLSNKRLRLDSLEKTKRELETLREDLARLKGEESSLSSRVMNLPEIKNAKSKLDSLQESIDVLRTKESELISELSSLKSRKDFLEKKVGELKKFRELASSEVKDFLEELNEKRVSVAKINAEVESRKLAIEQLSSAESKCPVCGAPISDPKEHIKKHEDAINLLNLRLQEERVMLQELEIKQREAQKQKAEVERAKLVVKDLEQYESELEKIKIAPLEKELSFIREKLSKQEHEKDELVKAAQREELASKLELVRNKIKMFESDLSSKKFDEDLYLRERKELIELEKSLSSVKAKLSQVPGLIEARESEISSLTREIREVENAKAEKEKVENALKKLSVLVNSIADVQVLVRKGFVELVNELLGDIWSSLYPYGDYSSLRIFVQENGRRAGDYVLQLKEQKRWVNVDGVASGGERSIASLALRVAFARALSKLNMLLLDEPTHNLDENGIDKLATVLREGMPSVLEQVIIITHEERMEPAATGSAYRLLRDKAKQEPTRVESL